MIRYPSLWKLCNLMLLILIICKNYPYDCYHSKLFSSSLISWDWIISSCNDTCIMVYNIFVVISLTWLKIKVTYGLAYQKESLSGLKVFESTPLSESEISLSVWKRRISESSRLFLYNRTLIPKNRKIFSPKSLYSRAKIQEQIENETFRKLVSISLQFKG